MKKIIAICLFILLPLTACQSEEEKKAEEYKKASQKILGDDKPWNFESKNDPF